MLKQESIMRTRCLTREEMGTDLLAEEGMEIAQIDHLEEVETIPTDLLEEEETETVQIDLL